LAKDQLSAGPAVYGVLLGAIGLGAIGTAFVLPRVRARLSPDAVVAIGTGGTGLALVLYAVARDVPMALIASLLAGGSWIASVSTINLSAQLALPDWVRGRGLAIYVTMFNGAVALGSVLWGEVAAHAGLATAHLVAAVAAVVCIPLTWKWKLQAGARLDLTPSMHWPEPVLAEDLAPQAGPVLVLVQYRVRAKERQPFLRALEGVGAERRRDGAYAWQVFEDTSEPDRFIETFLLESWAEHLRQHARVTHADQALQDRIDRFLISTPKVTHFVAPAERPETSADQH
jgi:quinol monooxygenase YgiN